MQCVDSDPIPHRPDNYIKGASHYALLERRKTAMILSKLLVTIIFLSFGVFDVYASSLERPFEKAAQQYYQKLIERQFDELERVADESRKNNVTISDGQPKLAAIYGGVAGCLSSGCYNRLSEAQWQDRYQLLLEWRKKAPQSVTAEIALASFFIEHAWAIRGQGYANTVRSEAWPGFHESMEIALKHLEGATPAAKNDPGWYAAMLAVGVAQGWKIERFEHIYKKGTEKYPLYLPLYFKASSYFAPRWYGAPATLRAFIEKSVAATRSQLGETLYARLNWSLWTQEMFKNGQADWPRMKTGFERIVADYPDPWNVNNFAKFACLAGDRATIISLLDKIGDRPIEAAWGTIQYYHQCVDYAIKARSKK